VRWDVAGRKEVGGVAAGTIDHTLFWLSPDGTLLASGSWTPGDPLRLFDLAALKELKPLSGFKAAFSADGRRLGVSGWDGAYRVYDTHSWAAVSPELKPGGVARALEFSPDGRLLVTGTAAGQVSVWDTATWTSTRPFEAHSGAIHTLLFSPDGRTLASSGKDPVVKLWNTATWRLSQTLKSGEVTRMQFTPDGTTLITGGPGPSIRFWRAP